MKNIIRVITFLGLHQAVIIGSVSCGDAVALLQDQHIAAHDLAPGDTTRFTCARSSGMSAGSFVQYGSSGFPYGMPSHSFEPTISGTAAEVSDATGSKG